MPHLKEPKEVQPLWKEWDQKAQKKGIRNTVYSVNGDHYTGEWLQNKKHGIIILAIYLQFSDCSRVNLLTIYHHHTISLQPRAMFKFW